MATPTTTAVTRTVTLTGGLSLTIREWGTANPGGEGILLLHGGAGPGSVAGIGAAMSQNAYVVAVTHPGFDGTDRPDEFDSITDLALTYLDLLDILDLKQVMVFGNSVGGWIASQMALSDIHGRISCLVLANAVGIAPSRPGEIVDVRTITPTELGKLAFHNPALRPDPASFTEQQRAMQIANQATLAVYANRTAYQHDPKLKGRLHRITLPVLVLWGEHDGVAPVEYGQAFAESFANGHFQPIPQAAHFPHLEQPAATLAAIGDFVTGHVKPNQN
jgi:pimeloyl-ACP methyl ester carboxylesterase